jgi:hypothetical protein
MHMMALDQYEAQREMSDGLFKNRLVVPVASAVLTVTEAGGTFTATDVRHQLGGRAESNQIREVIETRLEMCGAVEQLPYPGRPHPRTWERLENPFWAFIEHWVG